MPRLSAGGIIAITRPIEDGVKLVAELKAQGQEAVAVPMLRIEPLDIAHAVAQAVLKKPQAICVTSRHAVRAMIKIAEAHAIPLFTVGSATAEEANQAGFVRVTQADGNAESLLSLMLTTCMPENGAILYVRGDTVTVDLTSLLAAKGFTALQVTAYKSMPVENFTQSYIDAIVQGQIGEVRFYSRASAENYVRIARAQKLEAWHKSIIANCISEAVAQALAGFPWKQR